MEQDIFAAMAYSQTPIIMELIEKEPMSPREIKEKTRMSQPRISQVMRQLLAVGLVELVDYYNVKKKPKTGYKYYIPTDRYYRLKQAI